MSTGEGQSNFSPRRSQRLQHIGSPYSSPNLSEPSTPKGAMRTRRPSSDFSGMSTLSSISSEPSPTPKRKRTRLRVFPTPTGIKHKSQRKVRGTVRIRKRLKMTKEQTEHCQRVEASSTSVSRNMSRNGAIINSAVLDSHSKLAQCHQQQSQGLQIAVNTTRTRITPVHPRTQSQMLFSSTKSPSPALISPKNSKMTAYHPAACGPDDAHKPPLAIHLKRRVALGGKIYQFYSEVPEVVLEEKRRFIRTDDIILESTLGILMPPKGLEHVFHMPSFSIPSAQEFFAMYLGHDLKCQGKLDLRRAQSKYVPSHIFLSDTFHFLCKLCLSKNAKKIIFKGSSKSFETAWSHAQSFHPDGAKAKNANTVAYIDEDGFLKYKNVGLYAHDDVRQVTSTVNALNFFIACNLPFNVADSAYYKIFVKYLDPKMRVAGRKSMTDLLKYLVNANVQPALKTRLKSLHSLALFIDGWSSSRNQGVIGIRVSSITDQWTWRLDTLAVEKLDGTHSADYIQHLIAAIVKKFELVGKIRYIVTDKGANYLAASHDLAELGQYRLAFCQLEQAETTDDPVAKPEVDLATYGLNDRAESTDWDCSLCTPAERLDALGILIDSYNPHVHAATPNALADIQLEGILEDLQGCRSVVCAAHLTQTCIKTGIKNCPILSDIKERVHSLHRFCNGRQDVRARIDKKCGKTVLQPVETRWSYIIKSAKRLTEMNLFVAVREEVRTARANSTEESILTIPQELGNEFFMCLQYFVEILEPLWSLTDKLQKDGITAHQLLSSIVETFIDLNLVVPHPELRGTLDTLIANFAKAMKEEYVTDSDFLMAAFLNPELGLKFFTHLDSGSIQVPVEPKLAVKLPPPISHDNVDPPSTSTDTRRNYKKILKEDFINNDTKEYLVHVNYSSLGFPSREGIIELAREKLPADCYRLPDVSILQKKHRSSRLLAELNSPSEIDKMSEYSRYCHLTQTKNFGDQSLTGFWTTNVALLPNLSKYAQILFLKPTTTGPVERLFSELAYISSKHKGSIDVAVLNQRQLYKDTLKFPRIHHESKGTLEHSELDLAAAFQSLSVGGVPCSIGDELTEERKRSCVSTPTCESGDSVFDSTNFE